MQGAVLTLPRIKNKVRELKFSLSNLEIFVPKTSLKCVFMCG